MIHCSHFGSARLPEGGIVPSSRHTRNKKHSTSSSAVGIKNKHSLRLELCPKDFAVWSARFAHDPMCPRPAVSTTRCVQGPLCARPDLSKTRCVHDTMCSRPTATTRCVQGPLCPRPDVSKARCVHDPMWPRPTVSTTRCVQGPLCP